MNAPKAGAKPPGFETIELRSACWLATPPGWTLKMCSPMSGVIVHHPIIGTLTWRSERHSADEDYPQKAAAELAAALTAIMAQWAKERT